MALNKNSYDSDAIGNLYRAALYLARGSTETGIQFLIKAQEKLEGKLDPEISFLTNRKKQSLESKAEYSYWAEKVLDQYLKLKS
jgi:hypothetical protein